MKKTNRSDLFYSLTHWSFTHWTRGSIGALTIVAMLLSTGCFLDNATSQTQNAPAVSTPTPKSTEEAAKDLKASPPLNPAKLGDPMPIDLWVKLSELLNPAVVAITTSAAPRSVPTRYRDPLQEFLEDFWGGRGGPPNMAPPNGGREPVTALGTGFIIREDGLIITNNHVVEQADVINVHLANEPDRTYEAQVIGRDSRTDIALIKIDAKKKLPTAQLGNSENVKVGEWVAAFGNPYGHAQTMTTGIISAIGREITEINRFPFIQTDASINPGNSGGPLVNSLGYVIGVNTAIDARAQGIGFAIPIDYIKQIIPVLEKDGRIRRGVIGVGIATVNSELAASLGMSEPRGALVTQLFRGQPADKAGIEPYDIIIEFNGKKIDTTIDLQDAVGAAGIGSTAKVKVWRYDRSGKRQEKTFNVKIAENPEEPRQASRPNTKSPGMTAPFGIGFKISDYSDSLAKQFGISPDTPKGPIITDVQRGTRASQMGIAPGDVILDVNREPVGSAKDVVSKLKKDRNMIRLVRGNMVMILSL